MAVKSGDTVNQALQNLGFTQVQFPRGSWVFPEVHFHGALGWRAKVADTLPNVPGKGDSGSWRLFLPVANMFVTTEGQQNPLPARLLMTQVPCPVPWGAGVVSQGSWGLCRSPGLHDVNFGTFLWWGDRVSPVWLRLV